MVSGKEDKLGLWDGTGNKAGVFFPDHIPLARNDQGRDGNGAQLIGTDVGLVYHQSQQFGVVLCALRLFGKPPGNAVSRLDGELLLDIVSDYS